jgi:hypothetical protein
MFLRNVGIYTELLPGRPTSRISSLSNGIYYFRQGIAVRTLALFALCVTYSISVAIWMKRLPLTVSAVLFELLN